MAETQIKPQIIMDDYTGGYHNRDLEKSRERLSQAKTYKDLSTICIIPTRGTIHYKVVQSWMSLMAPMNNKFIRIFVAGLEVGAAYTQAVEMILANPELSKWKYILTMEEDNCPSPDGLLKLYENMDKFDVIGGLYWTKGEGGQPMIYGNHKSIPLSFMPQIPQVDTVQECLGLGMGFDLFKMSIFKDPNIPKPFFRTIQEHEPYKGSRVMTQDLYFFENIHRLGYKVACDTRVKVGHFDAQNDIMW
jgi:hypothetical protein